MNAANRCIDARPLKARAKLETLPLLRGTRPGCGDQMPLLPELARAATTGLCGPFGLSAAGSATSPPHERSGDRQSGARRPLDLLARFDSRADFRLLGETGTARRKGPIGRKRPRDGRDRFGLGWCFDSRSGDWAYHSGRRLRRGEKQACGEVDLPTRNAF